MNKPIPHDYFLYAMALFAAIATAKFGYDYDMQWIYIGSALELCIPVTCYAYIQGRNDTWKDFNNKHNI